MTQRFSRIHTIQEICRIYHQMYDFSNSSTTEPESTLVEEVEEQSQTTQTSLAPLAPLAPLASLAPTSFWNWVMTKIGYYTS